MSVSVCVGLWLISCGMVHNTEFQACSIKSIQQPVTIALFSAMRDYYEENWKTYQLKLTVVDFSR